MCPSLPCVPECELFTCTLLFLVPVPSRLPFSALQALLVKLSSFFANVLFFFLSFIFVVLTQFQPPLLISSDDNVHHKLIGTSLLFAFAISDIQIAIILILEHVCLSYGSQSKPTRDEVLDQAYSRYCASDIRNEVTEKFSAPPDKYSILQYTEFILKHRL